MQKEMLNGNVTLLHIPELFSWMNIKTIIVKLKAMVKLLILLILS